MAPDNRIAICPGTFDPVTYGHLDVIGRASSMYDELLVAVVNLPWRKGKTVFTAEERVRFVENATQGLANVSVEPFRDPHRSTPERMCGNTSEKNAASVTVRPFSLHVDMAARRKAARRRSLSLGTPLLLFAEQQRCVGQF